MGHVRQVSQGEVETVKLIHSINVTMDGCCDHTEVIADDDLHNYARALLDHSDCLLFGRVTYELFESYWPSVVSRNSGRKSEIDLARKLDEKPKYLFSRTRDKVDWKNSFVLKNDLTRNVSQLKKEGGNKLLMFGSPTLALALAQLGLIDEHHFLVQPTLAGRGPRMFEGIEKANLTLVESRAFASGVMMLRYIPVQ
jgi:dihydrofolate reductase